MPTSLYTSFTHSSVSLVHAYVRGQCSICKVRFQSRSIEFRTYRECLRGQSPLEMSRAQSCFNTLELKQIIFKNFQNTKPFKITLSICNLHEEQKNLVTLVPFFSVRQNINYKDNPYNIRSKQTRAGMTGDDHPFGDAPHVHASANSDDKLNY